MGDFLETVIKVSSYYLMGLDKFVISFTGLSFGVLYLIIHFVLIGDFLHALFSMGVAMIVNGFFVGMNLMSRDNHGSS